MNKTKVSISLSPDYSIERAYAAVKSAVDNLGGMSSFVKPGQRVLLKPNMLMGKPPEAAVTTHPSIVEAAVILTKETGGIPFIGDSPGLGSTQSAAKKCGIADVAARHSIEIVDLKTPILAEAASSGRFKRFEVAKEALDADVIINLPKLKTHAQMYLTMGVKNIFGCVPGTRKAQWHLTAGVDVSFFAAMIMDLYTAINPRLTIIDAVVSMEGNGPSGGTPRQTGFVAASVDAAILDAAIAQLMGKRPQDVPVLKEAELRGLLSGGYELLGDTIPEDAFRGFKFPPLMHTNFASVFPSFIDKRIRKALSLRPHIDHAACTMCLQCVRICPPSVMTDKGKILIDYDKCIRCYCCQEICPQGAISVKKGWLSALLKLG